MDDDLSMDSFVDIVANTVGIVIILTMLTIAQIDRKSQDVDLELKAKMDQLSQKKDGLKIIAGSIVNATQSLTATGYAIDVGGLDLESMDSKMALDTATVMLEQMDKIRKDSEALKEELALAKGRRDDAKAHHARANQSLTDLRTRKTSITTAMQVRKQREAQLVTDLPDLNMTTFKQTPLTSLKQEVSKLNADIEKKESEANIDRKEFNGLQQEVGRLTKEKAALDEELAGLEEVTGLNIDIPRPPSLGEQMKLPVFFECFSKAPETGGPAGPRVRFVGEGESPEGEHYRNIADPASEFSKFLAEQTEEFKASRRLHFIVRPDAGAAFREARKVARAAGWTVGWNPIGRDVDLNIGAAPSETTTASTRTPALVAPR